MYAHRGVLGVGVTVLSVVMFVSAIFGAATLLIPKRWAPYFIYASVMCFFIGGIGFSFVPFLLHFVPRESWGIGMTAGNSVVVVCLAALQLATWRGNRAVYATS